MYDPVQKPSAECQAYIITLENALSGIGDLVGASLGSTDPDTIRRRVKDILAEHNTAKTAALKRICEVIGAPVPVCPDDAVEAVTTLLCTNEGHNLRADRAEETVAEIATVLDRYDIPTHYDDASHPCADGQPITLVDRVHLGMTILNDGLIGAVARLRNAEQFLACRDDELRDANDALDAIGAPRGAGKRDRLLDVASRIRASLSR